jgi:dipeptidyl aminopeptidase/acylaminoacyl peptidase
VSQRNVPMALQFVRLDLYLGALLASVRVRTYSFVCLISLFFGSPFTALHAQAARVASVAIPAQDFFRLPDVSRPALSPDGDHMAFLARRGSHLGLAVIDLEKRSSQFIATLPEADIVEFHWVNSQRLVFVSGNLQDPVGSISPWKSGGLFAVSRDGSDARRLALPLGDGSAVVVRPRITRFLSSLSDGSDDIIVASNERTFDSTDVYRLNTRSARKTLLTFDSPGDVLQWALDRDGVPRGAISQKGLRVKVSYRRDEKSPWVTWTEGDFREPASILCCVGYDGSLIGQAFTDKSNASHLTAAMVRLDERGQTQQVLASSPDIDMQQPIFDPVSKKLVGAVSFHGTQDKQPTVWIDSVWAALQKNIDEALPNAINQFTPPEQTKRMLVFSYSDRNPGTVYLMDLRTRKLEKLIDARPWIKPEQMADSRMVKFSARDDLPMTALLTTPRGVVAKNLPAVVLIHGGPWVEGYSWRWNAEAQFFASRGYAVIQPNFRGTVGFGLRHLLASFKQWGLAMQDDVTDAAQWAVKQGVADPKRMCVYGKSYGGYAALQGLVRAPDAFKCGISYAGLSDLQLAHSVTWSDSSDSDFLRYLFPVMVGDPERDRAQLRATSPAQNAEKIKAAVMIAHGGEDTRVPIVHAERMRAALDREGKTVDWLVKNDESHGFVKLENRVEFYTRVEAFLRRHIGGN